MLADDGSIRSRLAGFGVFPVMLIDTAVVYWVFRGKVRPGDGYVEVS